MSEVTHACPPEGSGVTPCCGQTLFELPGTDRMTLDPTLVNCTERSDREQFNKLVQAERGRQVEKGYDAEHDDRHGVDHLLRWAIEYAFRGDRVKTAALIDAARALIARRAGVQ